MKNLDTIKTKTIDCQRELTDILIMLHDKNVDETKLMDLINDLKGHVEGLENAAKTEIRISRAEEDSIWF